MAEVAAVKDCGNACGVRVYLQALVDEVKQNHVAFVAKNQYFWNWSVVQNAVTTAMDVVGTRLGGSCHLLLHTDFTCARLQHAFQCRCDCRTCQPGKRLHWAWGSTCLRPSVSDGSHCP
jgi:hypothetical protein